jgi:hypothetical protein
MYIFNTFTFFVTLIFGKKNKKNFELPAFRDKLSVRWKVQVVPKGVKYQSTFRNIPEER